MKRFFTPLLVVLMFLAACSSEPSFTVKVRVAGENLDGQPVRVATLDDQGGVRNVDSTVVKNNAFTLKGKLTHPEFYLVYIGQNGPMELFLENSKISVECDINDLSEAQVTGSATHDVFLSFFAGLEAIAQSRTSVQNELADESLELSEERRDSLYALIEDNNQKVYDFMVAFFKDNNESVASPFLLRHTMLDGIKSEDLREVVDGFGPSILESRHAIAVMEHSELVQRVAVGARFTDFTMKDVEGATVSLSDYVGKGKYVLMDVWAAWCAPCRAANPTLVAVYNKFKSENFEIVGVSLDRDSTAWLQGIADDKLPWPQMSDLSFWQSEVVSLYNINAIPFAILFDPEGNIVENPVRADQLEEVLQRHLNP